MITVLTSHRVADYDDWKAAYDRTDSGPLASDVRSYRIWRDLDDPNLVIVAETFESREIAEAVLAHPELAEAIVKAGVDTASMKLQFVEEVAFATKQ
jgi:hypothetical protein